MATLSAAWALCRACWGLPLAHLSLLSAIASMLASPLYAAAIAGVTTAAEAPSPRAHHSWHEVRRVAKAWGWSGAVHRRIEANEHTARLHPGPSHLRELAVELAYHQWRAAHPEYRVGTGATWDEAPSIHGTGLPASVHVGV